MSRSIVLLKNEVARNYTDIGQHLLFQQHVPIICCIYFDDRVHEYEVGSAHLRHTDRYPCMTDFVKVVRLRNNQPAAMFFFDVAGA